VREVFLVLPYKLEKYLCWFVFTDIIKARKDYRVLGCYLGQDPRSTGGGLPLKLMKDEVSLLLEGG
jgi:hypothetical protein